MTLTTEQKNRVKRLFQIKGNSALETLKTLEQVEVFVREIMNQTKKEMDREFKTKLQEAKNEIEKELKEIVESKDFNAEATHKITSDIFKEIRVKGEIGDKGKQGDKPIVGIDFPQPKDGNKGDKPIVGVDFPFPKDGKDADESKIISKVIKKIPKPKDGKDGSPDTGDEIIDKINSALGKIDMSHINMPIEGKRIGRQISGSGAGAEIVAEVPSGNIDGSNTTFTLARTPRAGTVKVFLNGQRLHINTGFTISGRIITMDSAPATNNSLICDYEPS